MVESETETQEVRGLNMPKKKPCLVTRIQQCELPGAVLEADPASSTMKGNWAGTAEETRGDGRRSNGVLAKETFHHEGSSWDSSQVADHEMRMQWEAVRKDEENTSKRIQWKRRRRKATS